VPIYINNSRSDLIKHLIFAAQVTVASIFFTVGYLELFYPLADMTRYLPWVDAHPLWFTRTLGIVDILGAMGIFLPSIAIRGPKIILAAAVGCAAKQCVAIIYHSTYGVPSVLPVNALLLSLSLLVAWFYLKEVKKHEVWWAQA
jgi:hypothetical protein